jgi:hypothetical protein
MPIDQSKLCRVDEAVDSWLKRRDSASNEDKPPRNPLEAPPQMPFSDSPPGKIHGEGKQDQDFWNKPEKPPIPLMRL